MIPVLNWTWEFMCVVLFEYTLLLLIEELERLYGVGQENILGIENDSKASCGSFDKSINVEDSFLFVFIPNWQVNLVWIFNSKLEHLGSE